jgi:hypothetical protein
MEPARPLHDIFSGLAHGPAEPGDALRAGGHGELPDALVAEAIVSYAGTAPAEVAEHLAPFVTGHGPVPHEDPTGLDLAHGLDLLATVPPPEPATEDSAPEDPFELAFGEGTGGEGTGGGEPAGAVALDPATGTEDVLVGLEAGSDPGMAQPEPDPADLFPMPGPAEPDEAADEHPGEVDG